MGFLSGFSPNEAFPESGFLEDIEVLNCI